MVNMNRFYQIIVMKFKNISILYLLYQKYMLLMTFAMNNLTTLKSLSQVF